MPVVFNNGSNYDYHFSLKNQQMSLGDNLKVLGGNKETHKTFSVPIKNKFQKSLKMVNKLLSIYLKK